MLLDLPRTFIHTQRQDKTNCITEFIVFTKSHQRILSLLRTSQITMKYKITDTDAGVKLEKLAGV